MPSDLPDKVFQTEAEMETWIVEIRERTNEARILDNLTYVELGKRAGMPQGTLTAFLGGTYNGRNDRQAAILERWLNYREAQRVSLAQAPKGPGFLMTPTAQSFLATMKFAQETPDMVVIAGVPGVGKTSAADYYEKAFPNVHLITGQPCAPGPNAIIQELCQSLGASSYGAPNRASREIVKRLKGTGGLIIADEAQNWDTRGLDQLRYFHDQCRIGVVLMGNEQVATRIEGAAREVAFAQLFSRVGRRVRRPQALKEDIQQIIAGWGITDEEVSKRLRLIGKKPGALRQMGKVIASAFDLARGEGVELHLRHVDMAWQQAAPGEAGGQA